MKIKANKILAVLCVIAMVMTMIVPMTMTATATDAPVATFDFGENGSAAHVDGSSLGASKSYTNGSYTLSLTGMSSVYGPAFDATGNSCIKLGTSSKTGTFTFSVPEDVTSVIIYAAKYKANTTKLNVNGATYTLTNASNNGAYDAITVDTTSTKTVTFATVSGGVRCMVNTIEFYAAADDSGCEHVWGEGEITTAPDCTNSGVRTFTCSECGDTTTEPVAATGHTFVDGICSVCGEIQPDTTLTIEKAIEVGSKKAHDTYTDGKYYVAGVVTDIYNTTYGNMYITDGENTLTVYGTYNADGSARFDAMETKPAVGDTVIVYGVIGQYNDTPQIKNGWIQEIIPSDGTADIRAALDEVNAYMSLAYKYVGTVETVTVPSTVVDTLNRATTGVTGTSYASWSGKTVSSGAVYAGQSAGGNSSIQLRSDNNNSGIITTTSGGNARKITVTWNSNTAVGRTIKVYGSNTPYSSAEDLYNIQACGTVLGTIVNGTSTELVIEGDYAYIGIRSDAKALYLTDVTIEWETGNGTGGTQEVEVLSNSQFVLNCGVDASLENIEGVDSYGIEVTAGNNTVYYTTEANSWTVGNDDTVSVSIDLGDIINNTTRLNTEFTVRAFVVVGENTYVSELTKTYSVASMVEEYYEVENITEVEHLYNILFPAAN